MVEPRTQAALGSVAEADDSVKAFHVEPPAEVFERSKLSDDNAAQNARFPVDAGSRAADCNLERLNGQRPHAAWQEG